MDIQEIITRVVEIIRNHLSNEYMLILFGSYAKGTNLPTSDVDIGIFGSKKVDFAILSKIRSETDNIKTLRSIDIVDLQTLNKAYRLNVLSTGKELHV